MLWGCFAVKGTSALQKIDGVKRNYVEILKQHLMTSARELELVRSWVFKQDNGPHKFFLKFVLEKGPKEKPMSDS